MATGQCAGGTPCTCATGSCGCKDALARLKNPVSSSSLAHQNQALRSALLSTQKRCRELELQIRVADERAALATGEASLAKDDKTRIQEGLQSSLRAANESQDKLIKDLDQSRVQEAHLTKRIHALEEEAKEAAAAAARAEATRADVEAALSELKGKVESLQSSRNDLQVTLIKEKDKCRQLEARNADLQADVSKTGARLARAEAAEAGLKEEKRDFTLLRSTLESEVKAKQAELGASSKFESHLQSQVKILQAELQSARTAQNEAEEQIAAQHSVAAAEMVELRQRFEEELAVAQAGAASVLQEQAAAHREQLARTAADLVADTDAAATERLNAMEAKLERLQDQTRRLTDQLASSDAARKEAERTVRAMLAPPAAPAAPVPPVPVNPEAPVRTLTDAAVSPRRTPLLTPAGPSEAGGGALGVDLMPEASGMGVASQMGSQRYGQQASMAASAPGGMATGPPPGGHAPRIDLPDAPAASQPPQAWGPPTPGLDLASGARAAAAGWQPSRGSTALPSTRGHSRVPSYEAPAGTRASAVGWDGQPIPGSTGLPSSRGHSRVPSYESPGEHARWESARPAASDRSRRSGVDLRLGSGTGRSRSNAPTRETTRDLDDYRPSDSRLRGRNDSPPSRERSGLTEDHYDDNSDGSGHYEATFVPSDLSSPPRRLRSGRSASRRRRSISPVAHYRKTGQQVKAVEYVRAFSKGEGDVLSGSRCVQKAVAARNKGAIQAHMMRAAKVCAKPGASDCYRCTCKHFAAFAAGELDDRPQCGACLRKMVPISGSSSVASPVKLGKKKAIAAGGKKRKGTTVASKRRASAAAAVIKGLGSTLRAEYRELQARYQELLEGLQADEVLSVSSCDEPRRVSRKHRAQMDALRQVVRELEVKAGELAALKS